MAARRSRRAWGSLSRDQIIDAAAVRAREHGFDSLSIRTLARDLSTSPMSLYGHVRDKDDILDELTERLLSERWRPRVPVADWRRFVTSASEKLRDVLVREPLALHTYLTHPVTSPTALARMEAMLTSLRGAGLDEKEARRAYGAVHTYTIGFAALEASRSAHGHPTPDDTVVRELNSYTTAAQFRHGLDLILDGVEGSLVPSRP